MSHILIILRAAEEVMAGESDPMPTGLFNNLKRPVVVAMVAMRMMEVAVHEVVNMVTMRNGGMPAFGAVNMLRGMFGGSISRRAFVGIGRINGDGMFIHMVAMRMMKMASLKVVYMPFMPDGGVAASGRVDVRRIRVGCMEMFAHIFSFLFLFLRALQNNNLIPSLSWQEMFLQVTHENNQRTQAMGEVVYEHRKQNEIAPWNGFMKEF